MTNKIADMLIKHPFIWVAMALTTILQIAVPSDPVQALFNFIVYLCLFGIMEWILITAKEKISKKDVEDGSGERK